MSKKPFDDIESLIKQLADAQEPAFEEASWVKMEQLLDKEKEAVRRRPLFFLWWLVPIMLAGGAISYVALNNKGRAVSATEALLQKKPAPIPGQTSYSNKRNTSNQTSPSGEVHANPSNANVGSPELPSPTTNNRKYDPRTETGSLIRGANKSIGTTGLPASHDGSALGVISKYTTLTGQERNQLLIASHSSSNNKIPSLIGLSRSQPLETSKDFNLKENQSGPKKLLATKAGKRGFYFLASGGVEMNGVRLLPATNPVSRIGLGVGYQLNQRLSFQSGLYSSTKKYVAGARDYKPKAGTYWSTVDIKKVEADCQVIEIPVSIRYNLRRKKEITYFSSAALSSFLMKKEGYKYTYEHYGVPYNSAATYTGNKHLFSVARVAVGAEKELNANWSIQVSPGFSVPLAGVGEGEVRLYSTDIMLGLKFSPSKRKPR